MIFGSTSERCFSPGGTRDPLGATERVLQTVSHMAAEGSTPDQFPFTAALTNGRDLYAFRYAAHDSANTLYFRQSSQELLVVSEPLDAERDRWTEVPEDHALLAREGESAHRPASFRRQLG